MAVLVITSSGERIFCAGIRWVTYARRPSLPTIRREAINMGMTNFIQHRSCPNRIGYLKMVADEAEQAKKGKSRTESLLLAVLANSEPLTYVECDLGPSGIWVMASDETGTPIPGSDSLFDDDELDGFKSSLAGFTFKTTHLVDADQIDEFLSALPSAVVRIRSISYRPYYIATGFLVVSSFIALQSLHIIHERNLLKLQEEARHNLLLSQPKAQAAAPDEPSAGEWVNICMHNAYSLPPYKNGWTLISWECAGRSLSALWSRSGGTIADAPVGLMLNNGNDVRSHYPLVPFSKTNGPPKNAPGDAKAFIAFIQQSEQNLSVKTSDLVKGRHSGAQNAYMVAFLWQGDPREIPWDYFRNIQVERLGREVNSIDQGQGRHSDFQIHVSIKENGTDQSHSQNGRPAL